VNGHGWTRSPLALRRPTPQIRGTPDQGAPMLTIAGGVVLGLIIWKALVVLWSLIVDG